MILDSYNNYLNCAKGLDGFIDGQKGDVPYDIDILANGYVKAEDDGDEIKRSQYFSALMIRYWHMVTRLYETSHTLDVTVEDMVDWLSDSLLKAFKYRSWLDSNKEVSKDPKGAEKCINQCITSTRQYWFKHFNQIKRKGMNSKGMDSLDVKVKVSSKDDANTMSLIETIGEEDNHSSLVVNEIISKLLKKKDILGALIIDGIVNQDTWITCEKLVERKTINEDGEEEDNSYKEVHQTFCMSRLNNFLRDMPESIMIYFSESYNIPLELVRETMINLNKDSGVTFRKKVNNSLDRIRNNKEIRSCLCM